jgi:methyltransferase (TIGR00027 family)
MEASRTAVMVAALRGRASLGDDPICSDPFALALAGEDGARLADAYSKKVPAIELWLGLRTARFDALVREATGAGVPQVVLLGAGLDTRAVRLARPGVRFFEVDQPESQADKLRRVRAIAGYAVDAATYVACDFETQDFFDALVAHGFDTQAPTIFVWEGVTYYLPEAAVRATLRSIATRTHPHSVVAFDFFGKRFVTGEVRDDAAKAAREDLADMGEPVRFGTNDVLPVLYEAGFRKVHVESFDEVALDLRGDYARERQFRFQSIAYASRTRRLAFV